MRIFDAGVGQRGRQGAFGKSLAARNRQLANIEQELHTGCLQCSKKFRKTHTLVANGEYV